MENSIRSPTAPSCWRPSGLDQAGDAAPCTRALVVAGEQRVLAIQSNGPGEIFDAVAVHLDTAVGEEELEAVPMAGDIGELLAEAGLGRDAGALLLQPVTEGLDRRRAACLPFGETALGRIAAKRDFPLPLGPTR